ncbi:hypothetical protein [Tateyamaria pelophila]|uniref:hypothetical protein n=1 Tax=Tateyamaria pelophila TaxID=328415 RepID=UPI001CBC5ED6|nr:hypothetical protein [Tateyamaria pelophila]
MTLDAKKEPKRSERRDGIVELGDVEELTGHDGPGKLMDGGTIGSRRKDGSIGE